MAMTKKQKRDVAAARQIIDGINDLISAISDIGNETGYTPPAICENSLYAMHKALSKEIETAEGK